MKRRFFAMLLSLAMLFTLAPTAFAVGNTETSESKPTEMNGNCGATTSDDVSWKLEPNNSDGEKPTYTLTISGSGDMADYYARNVQREKEFSGDIAPWRRALLSDTDAERTTEEVVPITEVVIGDGVTRIGSGAFAYTKLTGTVTFNENVHSYGDGVFAKDTLITAVDWTNFKPTVKIKDGWATVYKEEHIAVPYAFFDGCSSLATSIIDSTTYSGQLVLPDTIEAIYVAAFRGTGFSKVDFSDGLSSIKAVGSYAITKLANMTEFTYPGNVDFYGVNDKGQNNVIQGGGIQRLTIAKEVTKLPAYFCTNTENLTTVVVEDGSQLTTIGADAFTENNALKSIDISSPVTSVGDMAFYDCKALESVKIQGSSNVVYPYNTFRAWIGGGREPAPLKTLEIGAGKIQFDLSNQKDSIETVVLGDGVTEIPNNFATNCTKLTRVSLSDALTSVPASAFKGCSSLKKVGISENSELQSIGNNAFQNSGLTQIYIPKNVTSIGTGAFNRTPTTVFDMSDVLAESMTVGKFAINNWYDKTEKKPQWADDFKYIYVSNSGAANSVKEQTGSCKYAFVVTNGGTVGSSKTGLAAVSRAGYSVTWTSSNGTTVDHPEKATLISGETYTAKWKLLDNNVEITYKPNISGGNDKDVVRVAVKNSDIDVARELFSRTGYTFAGWNTNADGTGTAYKTGNTIKADTMTLYAQWTLDKPTISSSGTTTAVYGKEVILTANTAASGASYQWYKDSKEIPKATTDSLTLTNVADSGAYTVKITVGTDTATSEPTTVTITKATPTVSISADQTSLTGSGTVKLTIGSNGVPENGTVAVACDNGITVNNKDGMFTATLPNETKTYTFTASYAGDNNHNNAEATCKVSVTHRSSGSSSGSSTTTSNSVSASTASNGKVSLDKSTAKKGDTVTVTVTPDAGYQLDKLTVTDKNGNVLKLTDKGDGKYSFTMPDGKVEVKALFAKEVKTSPFDDVSVDAYYNKAVQWAQEKGITDGISSNLFGPKQPCTRSQIVTFLWRAAGSPEPKSTAAGMTDVVPGSYYAKAVAWAVENGITTGTAEGTFSPDATCTRAQAVTFLARAQNAKATGKTAFSDVPADSYFADAVAWAQANGVTTGTSETTFSPDNDCTRAQIVTFLYRANQGT